MKRLARLMVAGALTMSGGLVAARGADASMRAPTAVAEQVPAYKDIRPGAFCSPVGATGYYRGKRYVCSKTSATGKPYKGNRAHWRRG